MNYHYFLSLQVFESPYFSTLPRSVSPAGKKPGFVQAFSRQPPSGCHQRQIARPRRKPSRSAPHSHALFAALVARAAAGILAIFFTPPPPSLKSTNHRASITLHCSQPLLAADPTSCIIPGTNTS